MVEDRRVVRAALMRATIHLVTARDAVRLRPLVQPVLERTFRRGAPTAAGYAASTLMRCSSSAARRSRIGRGHAADLVAAFAERWPDADADAMGYAVQYLVPLVQVPPRGVWGKGGRATWAIAGSLARETLRRATLDRRPGRVRYLGAFGPASVMDMQSWSGLTRL